MGATATLSAASLAVAPGGEVAITTTVRNTGNVVDEFHVRVVGDAAPWARVDPEVLRLFPGTEATATVTFSPPVDSSVHAGEMAFGVVVSSKEDPEGSVVEEGFLDIGAHTDLSIELLPRTSRGRTRAKAELAIDNLSNVPLTVGLSTIDPDALLGFELDPPQVVIEPGIAQFAKITIKPRSTFWRGAAKSLPFQVQALTDGQDPAGADGMFVQEAKLPKWFWKAVLAAALVLLALIVLWYALLRPSIKSAARDAVQEEVAELAEQVAAAEESAGAASDAAGAAADAAEAATDAAGEAEPSGEGAGAGAGDDVVGDGGTGGGLFAEIGESTDFRIAAAPPTPAGGTQTYTYSDPDGNILSITDIVFQNPEGDIGSVEVLRNSDVLIRVGLGNFRDLDYHFVSPVRFDPGDTVGLRVECSNVDQPCSPAAYFAGGARAPSDDG